MFARKVGRLGARQALCRGASTHHADFAKNLPRELERKQMNLFTAVNSALDVALRTDSR